MGKSIAERKTAKRGRGINTVKDELYVDIHASGLLNFLMDLIFFPGHNYGCWENVVVNLAMAKKKFEKC